METPTRLRLSRFICDAIAIFIGFAVLLGVPLTLSNASSGFFCALMPIFLICAAVVGIGFGFSESPQVRRWLGVPVLAMCVIQLAVQGRLVALGVHNQYATSMSVWSSVSVTLLLCWLADRRIGRHVRPSFPLRLRFRFARVLSGLGSLFFLLTLIVGIYMVAQLDDPPKQLLSSLYMIWYASLLYMAVDVFWALTCPTQQKHALVDAAFAKVACVGMACNLIAMLGCVWQGDQPTLLLSLSMVVLAAIVAAVVMRQDFDPDKPLVFELFSGTQHRMTSTE